MSIQLFAFECSFSVTRLEIYDIIMVTIKDSINFKKKNRGKLTIYD